MKKNCLPRSKNCCTNKFFLLFVFALLVAMTILVPISFSCAASALDKVQRWFILLDYDPSGFAPDRRQLQNFDMAILDPDAHPDLTLFKKKTLLIAYVSVGEAEDYRFYWEGIKDAAFVVGENPDWKGNFYVDVRSLEWQQLIVEQVIPRLQQAGFQGVFLDTLDTAEFLESKDPQKYAGSKAAMIELVKAIHSRYPELLLVSNNGFPLLEELALYLSGVLAEDIFMMPDFANGGYRKVPAAEREYKIAVLKKIQALGRPVFNIEYASPKDKAAIRVCLRQSRRLGFKPYVAEKNLSAIYANE